MDHSIKTRDTAQAVRDLVAEQLLGSDGAVTDAQTLVEDLHADSLDRMELLVDLECEFGIDGDFSEVMACHTVGDLVALVQRKAG